MVLLNIFISHENSKSQSYFPHRKFASMAAVQSKTYYSEAWQKVHDLITGNEKVLPVVYGNGVYFAEGKPFLFIWTSS